MRFHQYAAVTAVVAALATTAALTVAPRAARAATADRPTPAAAHTATGTEPGPLHDSVGVRSSAPPAFIVAISGSGQSATTRSRFDRPLRVQVMDHNGHVVPDAQVSFSVQPQYGTFTGTASFPGGAEAHVLTGSDGIASSPYLTAGSDVGWLRVYAGVEGLSTRVTFDLNVGYSPAAQVRVVSGDEQSALVGTNFNHPLVVKVLDANGYPVVDGSRVTFQIAPAGPNPGTAVFPDGRTSATAGIRAGDGYATSPVITAGQVAGTFRVSAQVLSGPYAPSTVFTGTTLAQAPTTVETVQGNYQFASPGSAFGTEAQVRVLDKAGNPIPLAAAHAIVTGPAKIYGRTVLDLQADGHGLVRMPLYADADDSGPVTVTVASGPATATFTEFVADGGVATEIRGGDGQLTYPGRPFPTQLQVSAVDGGRRVVPDYPVTFAVDGPAVFSGGATSATVDSDAHGAAYAPSLQATDDPSGGLVTVTVTIAGSDATATFHLQVGQGNGMVITGGDRQSAPANTVPAYSKPFESLLSVKVVMLGGRPAAGVGVTFSVVQGPAVFVVNGTLTATTTRVTTGDDGQARVALYPEYRKTGDVTVTAAAAGYGSVTFTETVRVP